MKALSKLTAAIMAGSLLFGCSSSGSNEIPTIGVAQLVSHTSLNVIRSRIKWKNWDMKMEKT